ncbi:MAG: selenium-dependent molybdenum cofactor biosynthesis protein YqeB [Bacillota bacterium]|nr:selenium-dependent molybdenum cofactor biosynthesis protein YqeB [Bacillota bacterium]
MNKIVIVRGGGDIATGTIQKLYRVGFKLLILETAQPTCIRTTVSCAQAIYDSSLQIEDMIIKKVNKLEEIYETWNKGQIPIIVDEKGLYIEKLKPYVVVDGILAKKNLGTSRDMAPITIGLGPGFVAGEDVDLVIETKRGHNLARLIFSGPAAANTGRPGEIQGYSQERILRAPESGPIQLVAAIGDFVEKDQTLAYVNGKEVKAGLRGMVRGLIQEGSLVFKGMKIGDVDPRRDKNNLYTISDKARAIGGGVLEGILILENKLEKQEG